MRLLYWLGYFALLAVIAIGVLTFRFLNVAGVFAHVTPIRPGTCTALAGVIGPEDLEIDRANRLMFVSAQDRHADPKKPNPQDGLYVMHLDQKQQGFARLTPPSATFHPHGISLYTAPDGTRTLMAINHADPTQSSVDIYDVNDASGTITLAHRATISSTRFVMLNDLVAVGSSQFYAANQTGKRGQLAALLEMVTLRPGATIFYYDGEMPKVAAQDLTQTFGIGAAPDYSKIYVADSLRRKIVTFEGNPITGLTKTSELSVPGVPDNISVDADGNLWVASHLKGLKLLDYGTHPDRPSPSAVYELSVSNGTPTRAKPLYVDQGGQIASASVGAAFDGHLYVGAVYDNKILDCALR